GGKLIPIDVKVANRILFGKWSRGTHNRYVKCSPRSNIEPKQPNSGRCSPTDRVRRMKRRNSAISSRPTRHLPKTKNGWQSMSIRRFNGEKITTIVLPLLRKK